MPPSPHSPTLPVMNFKIALLTANLVAVLNAKGSCGPPPDLGKGVWSCSDPIWIKNTICQISGDSCAGLIKCGWRGYWLGKTKRFCPKTCYGVPKNPPIGGYFKCESGSCELMPLSGYNCFTNVKCNTKKGYWTGKSVCVFEVTDELMNQARNFLEIIWYANPKFSVDWYAKNPKFVKPSEYQSFCRIFSLWMKASNSIWFSHQSAAQNRTVAPKSA